MERIRAIFIGRVQNVGFRATAKLFADGLHLKGFARNLENGTVEIYAHGEKKDLETLIHKLEQHFSRYISQVEFAPSISYPFYIDFKTL